MLVRTRVLRARWSWLHTPPPLPAPAGTTDSARTRSRLPTAWSSPPPPPPPRRTNRRRNCRRNRWRDSRRTSSATVSRRTCVRQIGVRRRTGKGRRSVRSRKHCLRHRATFSADDADRKYSPVVFRAINHRPTGSDARPTWRSADDR